MDDKKQRIIEIAEQLFAQYGFLKTTMEDIAKKVHMGKSSVYYYFKSKDDIFVEVIRQDTLVFQKKLIDAVNITSTPEDKIRAYVTTRMTHLQDLSKFYSTLTDEYLDHYLFVEEVRKDFYDNENIVLKKLLEEGVKQNSFDVDDVVTISRMISIAIKGLEFSLFVEAKDYDPVKESNEMLDLIFNGIANR
ncbi:MAG: TetR/AcrR family transcriptional regulator [Candidatus Tenebribacter mawsonii]|nr:TetR/AcrR family transcriptional regulator [Candidatus Tenebribacter mawsonii]